eukprot:7378979-Prymnesium_polylepis.1
MIEEISNAGRRGRGRRVSTNTYGVRASRVTGRATQAVSPSTIAQWRPIAKAQHGEHVYFGSGLLWARRREGAGFASYGWKAASTADPLSTELEQALFVALWAALFVRRRRNFRDHGVATRDASVNRSRSRCDRTRGGGFGGTPKPWQQPHPQRGNQCNANQARDCHHRFTKHRSHVWLTDCAKSEIIRCNCNPHATATAHSVAHVIPIG